MNPTGTSALDSDHGVRVTADTVHGAAGDQRIDEWELFAARRALANLRELLYRQPMLDLLADQIEHANQLHKRYLRESDGRWSEGRVVLEVAGLHTTDFFPAVMALMVSVGADANPDEKRKAVLDFGFPAHPEHYGVPDYAGVIETMAGIPTLTRVQRIEDAPEFVTELIDESFPLRLTGAGELEDGTPHSFVLQQFKDTADGMIADLRIWYPQACPQVYLDEHAQHYTVEFRNMVRLAAATLARGE
jgi:hypothetical protein